MNMTSSQRIYSALLYIAWLQSKVRMLNFGAGSLRAQGMPTLEEISQAKHRFNLRAIKEIK